MMHKVLNKSIRCRALTRSFSSAPQGEVKKTVLYQQHVDLKGKMVPFAGYLLPVQYSDGMIQSHLHCRSDKGASLFDVSHMGQLKITGAKRADFLESLVVSDIKGLAPNQARLSSLTNERGGIIDDCMITNKGDYIYMVINAGCKEKDMKHLAHHLSLFNKKHGADVHIEEIGLYNELLALQGPKSSEVLSKLLPSSVDLSKLPFMNNITTTVNNIPCLVARSGYTGEDGFEISVPANKVVELFNLLLSNTAVKPAGLGVRDSLRLEAGLCLYGHDMTEDITPIEAGLLFTIGKRRRAEGGFPGFEVIAKQIAQGVTKKRIGFIIEKGPPAREESIIRNSSGSVIGKVTSGAFGPSVNKPIGMGYVDVDPNNKKWPEAGTGIKIEVRGKPIDAVISKVPFVPNRYFKPVA